MILKKFVKELIDNNYQEEYEIISLDKVNSIQVIDEAICDIDVDINKLNDITIPKPKVVEKEVVPKKKVNFTIVFLLVFILVVAMFSFLIQKLLMVKMFTILVVSLMIMKNYRLQLLKMLNLNLMVMELLLILK